MGATRPTFFPPGHPSITRVVPHLMPYPHLAATLASLWGTRVTHPERYAWSALDWAQWQSLHG